MKLFTAVFVALVAVTAVSTLPAIQSQEFGDMRMTKRVPDRTRKDFFKIATGKYIPKNNLYNQDPTSWTNSHNVNNLPPDYSESSRRGGEKPRKGPKPPSNSASQEAYGQARRRDVEGGEELLVARQIGASKSGSESNQFKNATGQSFL